MAGPSSIIGVQAFRVAKLAANGTPDFSNPLGGFMMCGGTRRSSTTSRSRTARTSSKRTRRATSCVVRKKPDRTKYCTFTLTMCRNDYRLNEMFGIGSNVTIGQVVVGSAVKSSSGCAGTRRVRTVCRSSCGPSSGTATCRW